MPSATKRKRTSRSARSSRPSPGYRRARTALLWLAAVRIVAGIVAIPLAPFLYKEHFLILVMLRPTKEVLLAGGFLARQDKVGVIELIVASLPLAVLGVWHFFALGRGFAAEIKNDKLPWVAQKVLPTKKIKALQKALRKKGARIVFLGRLAAFPSALLGAAAGSSEVKSDDFFPADGAGAALSMVEVIGAGYLLGEAYEKAGPWITGIGVVAMLAMMAALGWYMKRE